MNTPVQVKRIKSHILTLESFKSRLYSQPGNRKAAEYIQNELTSQGVDVERDSFTFKKGKYFNLVAAHKNKSRKTYMVCAHFDSIAVRKKKLAKTAPGADDNASGVAALLELSRVLREMRLKVNVMCAFFNIEEFSKRGSKHLARKFSRDYKRLDGVINLDTIGTWEGPISKKNPVNYVTNKESKGLLELVFKHFPHPLEPAQFLWMDDHASFWEKGFKAIELTEKGCTPYMHTPQDTTEKLHLANIARITDGLAVLLSKIR